MTTGNKGLIEISPASNDLLNHLKNAHNTQPKMIAQLSETNI